jgi:hypothetical protein
MFLRETGLLQTSSLVNNLSDVALSSCENSPRASNFFGLDDSEKKLLYVPSGITAASPNKFWHDDNIRWNNLSTKANAGSFDSRDNSGKNSITVNIYDYESELTEEQRRLMAAIDAGEDVPWNLNGSVDDSYSSVRSVS